MICALAATAAAAVACGDNGGQAADAPIGTPDGPAIDATPEFDARITFDHLSETGLCLDDACTQIAPDVLAYTPRAALYSDGATKKRWIKLPPGTQIDTTDMDYWEFPEGTKIWKEFTSGPTRVETRLIQKLGPTDDDWYFVPYIWNATQDDAIATPMGQDDANGTTHDVPSRAECRQCHDRTQGDVLGFSAIQLDTDATAGEVDLDDLIAMGALTAPPAGSIPHFPLPGTATDQAMLGYVHANCGHCHNPTSDVFQDLVDLDLRMRVGALGSVAETPLYLSTVDVAVTVTVDGATHRVTPHDPADSVVYTRFITTNAAFHMPKLGTETTDPDGQAIIETWINALP